MANIRRSMIKPAAVSALALQGSTSGQVLVAQGATSSPLWKSVSGDVSIAASGAVTIGAGKVTEAMVVANTLSALVAKDTTTAAAGAMTAAMVGIPVVMQFAIADAASGNQDFTGVPYKFRVTEVVYTKTGGAGNAGNSIAMHNGTGGNAITDAMNNATDTGTARAATIDDAFWTVSAAATIRFVTVRAGGNNAAVITVFGVRVP
jgi:hypothetical protein